MRFPLKPAWEACALGKWISVLSCITVSCSLAADGCVPSGWNDVKQAHILRLCFSPWAQSPSAVVQKLSLLPPLSLHIWPMCCCLCSRMCSPSQMLSILETFFRMVVHVSNSTVLIGKGETNVWRELVFLTCWRSSLLHSSFSLDELGHD